MARICVHEVSATGAQTELLLLEVAVVWSRALSCESVWDNVPMILRLALSLASWPPDTEKGWCCITGLSRAHRQGLRLRDWGLRRTNVDDECGVSFC